MPTIQSCFDQRANSKRLTLIEFKSGFWQMALRPNSQSKCAVVTGRGLKQFNVSPFGLMNAPAAFMRMMYHVFAPFIGRFVIIYVDDVLIHSETFDEHLDRLQQVFDGVRAVGLMASGKKCCYLNARAEYLGHIISADGRESHPDKLKRIAAGRSQKVVRMFVLFLASAIIVVHIYLVLQRLLVILHL